MPSPLIGDRARLTAVEGGAKVQAMENLHAVPIGVIGTGRLGSSLAAALAGAGYHIAAVAGRNEDSVAGLAADLGASAGTPADVLVAARLVFLAVPDTAIRPVCESLHWTEQHWAVHCSGATPLDALSAAAGAGGAVGTFHPLQSFPSRAPEPARFEGIYCGIEATGLLTNVLSQVARDLGCRVVSLKGVDRALYHAAAVFANNDAVALMSAAGRTWAMAGLPASLAREALSPLLQAASTNIANLDLAAALTGPVARGDAATVAAHLDALSAAPELRDLYRQLAAELLQVVTSLDPPTRAKLTALLRDDRT